MKKTLLFLAFILSTFSFAQTNGITYQAVIYSANGESVPGINNANAPLANRKICLQFSIVDDFSQTEYQEKITVTTDDYGMVNLIIGTGTQIGGYADSFETIVWNSAKKYLKVSLDQSGNCNSFDEISNQVLSYVPFALAANSASSVSGIVAVANGGTNASTVLGAKTNLQLQNVDNTADLNKPVSTPTQLALDSKVDKVVGKNLSTEDFTTAEKTKLASLGGTLDLSSYATITDLTTKVDKVAGKELSSNDYTTIEKTKLAAISGVNTGDQDLSALATAASVALKADIISPSLLGVPTAPTASSNTNTTQIATTAFVNTTVANKFVDLTTNQTISGTKTFNSDLIANGLIIGKGKGQNNYNTVFGAGALNSSNANGTRNTAIGYLALTQYAGTTFDNNTGVGYFNMIGLTTGYGNTSIGAETMFNVGTASNNTGIGNQSLINAAGDNNVGVGARSGDGLTTGTNNTFIGTQARTTSAGATISNATALGYGAVVTENNTIQLGNLGVTNVKTSGKLTTGAITLPNTDGTTGQILTTNGAGVVAWSSPTNISISTINETPNSNGATIANGVIKLSPADATNGGIVTTGNQTFSGNKEINGNLNVSGKVGVGTTAPDLESSLHISTALPVIFPSMSQTEINAISNPKLGMVQFNTTEKKLQVYSKNTTSITTVFGNSTTTSSATCLTSGALWFRPTISGNITKIELNAFGAGETASLVVKSDNSCGTPIVLGTSNSITCIDGWNTWTFATPVAVTAGTVYYITSNDANRCLGVRWSLSGDDVTTGNVNNMMGMGCTNNNFDPASKITVVQNVSNSNEWLNLFNTPKASSTLIDVANGGTGSSTKNFVDLTTDQQITGKKNFNSDIKVNGLSIGKGIGQVNEQNITVGENTLVNNTAGQLLIALGNGSLYSNTSANYNIGIGVSSLANNQTGENNIAIGAASLNSNTGANNTAVGRSASQLGNANSNVTSLGYQAGMINTGSSNTFLGSSADQNTASNSITNSTALGYGAKISAANQIQLGNTSVTNVKTSGTITAGTITYPNTSGTNGQVLMTNGIGNASWGSVLNFVQKITDMTSSNAIVDSRISIGGVTFQYSLNSGVGGKIQIFTNSTQEYQVLHSKNSGTTGHSFSTPLSDSIPVDLCNQTLTYYDHLSVDFFRVNSGMGNSFHLDAFVDGWGRLVMRITYF